jgi:ActD protein
MERSKSILMHFDNKHDLFHAIDVLQHFKISISEVYTPGFIPVLKKKLRVKEIRRGAVILKYGCMGAAATSTLVIYLLQSGILDSQAQTNYIGLALNIAIMALTFVIALYLFPSRVPKIKQLRSGNHRYLLVVKSSDMMTGHEQVTYLMKYAEAVELSPVIKNMIAC